MRKSFALFFAFIFLLSGCTFNVEVLTPVPSQPSPFPTPTPPPLATVFPESLSPTPDPINMSLPPLFHGLYFALSRMDASMSSFPAGTKQIYAIWNYQNMAQGMMVKREWYLDGNLWLTREEPWDFTKYGANGTIRDISIYDFDAGLPEGIYQLRLFIDGSPQPIGVAPDGQGQTWLNFEIKSSEEATAAWSSPDSKWGAYVYNNNRLVLRDSNGTATELFTGLEIPYLSWFGDSKHFLFVDRDRSGQKPGTTIGIRDHLWLVDVPSGTMRRLYKSDTSFAGYSGPMPSFDGRYIASLEGSRFGDACFIDTRLIFFELSSDFNSAKVIKQQDFLGIPAFNDGTVYPTDDGGWQNGNVFRVTLDGTCNVDKNKLGVYTFNLSNRTATQVSSSQLVPGDLGMGMIHGKITDASTGTPIANATVTCEQHSYTSNIPCSGSFTTNADGSYIFNTVYFHDTDTIKLTIQAAGYESREVTQSFFTFNDWEANVSLDHKP